VTPFQAPRGTHDVLPAEQPLWQLVTGTAAEVSALYGYQPILTPAFEDTELFARTSGEASDIVHKEMYTFTDRGGRSLTLRPEATAPIVRAYIEHGLHREPQPVKLFTIAPMYRYSAPQRGRHREFWQWSVEAIGSDDPAVDAEVIELYAEFLRRLGVTRYELQLNSIGDRSCRPAYVERLNAWLDEHEADLDEDARHKRLTSPLRVFDTKNPALERLLEGAPKIGESLCDDCHRHFETVRRTLDAYGIPYTIVPTLVRGLDYYSRTAFEFQGPEAGAATQIVGGGRYDYLAEAIGGPPTPAIGFGAGMERALIAVQEEGVEAPPPPGLDVFFVVEPGAPREDVLRAATALRRAGHAADVDYGGRSVKGQLTQASRAGARATVVVDASGNARIRRPGEADVEVPLDAVVDTLAP
jgi:histidyl-tRNA synthetase